MVEIIENHNNKIVKNIEREQYTVTIYFTDGSSMEIQDLGDTYGLDVSHYDYIVN